MQIVIDIPSHIYKTLIETGTYGYYRFDSKSAIKHGQLLPEDCEILSKEAYEDLCMRASKGAEHWIGDAYHYICPVCGFRVVNPNHFIGRRCPKCGFQYKKDKVHENGNDE